MAARLTVFHSHLAQSLSEGPLAWEVVRPIFIEIDPYLVKYVSAGTGGGERQIMYMPSLIGFHEIVKSNPSWSKRKLMSVGASSSPLSSPSRDSIRRVSLMWKTFKSYLGGL